MGLIRSSLIDLKNGLPPRALAEKIHPRGIVFVHVPKCAGTSVERALRRQFRLSRAGIDPELSFQAAAKNLGLDPAPNTQQQLLTAASEIRRDLLHYYIACNFKCITGHAPLGANTITAARQTHDFVTILRDPVERYVSHLTHNRTEKTGHGHTDQPIEAFLETARAHVMGNLYGKYFSGLPMTADFSSNEAVDLARKSLSEMQVVGFVSKMEKFRADAGTLIGRPLKIGHENRQNQSGSGFSPEIMDKISALCTADISIYQWALEQFS